MAAKCHLKTSTKQAIFRNLRGGPHGPGFSVGFSVLDKDLASVVAFRAGRISYSVLDRVLAAVRGPPSQKLQNGLDPVAVKCHLKRAIFRNLRGGPHGPGFSVGFSVLDKVLASVVAFLAGFGVSSSVFDRVLASVLGPPNQKLQNGPDPVAAKCHLKTSTKRAIFRNLWGGPHGPGFSVSFSVLDRF